MMGELLAKLLAQASRQNFAALPRDAGGRAEDGLRGGRAETD